MRMQWTASLLGLMGVLAACGQESAKVINDGVAVDSGEEVDEDPPELQHDYVDSAQPLRQDVAITVTVTDELSAIDTVAVVYKRADAAEWSTNPLEPVDEEAGTWAGVIPGDDVTGSVIYYYLHAIDASGNEAFAPNDGEANPQEFRVNPD